MEIQVGLQVKKSLYCDVFRYTCNPEKNCYEHLCVANLNRI